MCREHPSDTDDGPKESVDISIASQDIASCPKSYHSSDNRFVATRSKELNQKGRLRSVIVQLHQVSRSDTMSGSLAGRHQLTWFQVLKYFKGVDNKSFVDFFSEVIRWASGFDDYYFETPAMLYESLRETPFEFTLIDAGGTLVNRQTSSRDFASYIAEDQGSLKVKSFPNLGNDAMLLAPCHSHLVPKQAYGSLSTFLTNAPEEQVRALWRMAGAVALQHLEQCPTRPLWMSTDGRGVPWLHLRIDFAPKYYKHRSYAAKPSLATIPPVPVVATDSYNPHVQPRANNRNGKDEQYPTNIHTSSRKNKSVPLADNDTVDFHDYSDYYWAGAASVERPRPSQTGLSQSSMHKAPTSKYGSNSSNVVHPPSCHSRSTTDDLPYNNIAYRHGQHSNQPLHHHRADADRRIYRHLNQTSGNEGAQESSTVYIRDSYAATTYASKAPKSRDHVQMHNVTDYLGAAQAADTLSHYGVSGRYNTTQSYRR